MQINNDTCPFKKTILEYFNEYIISMYHYIFICKTNIISHSINNNRCLY